MKVRRLFSLLVAAAVTFKAVQSNAAKPNVLILLADQWRAQAFGYAGDPNVKTPHIDALARQSINFSNAISSVPVCAPTRASLLTGQRALTHGVFMNDVPLPNEAVTLAEVLKKSGYDTGYIGKWHLNGDGHRAGFIPRERRQGFDYWKVLECTHDYNHSDYFGDAPEKLQWQGYDAIAQTHDAQKFLENRSTNANPFLFVLSWGPPHSPYTTAPAKYRAMYDPAKLILRGNVPSEHENKIRSDLAGYYAHCTALDDCVGELMETLQKSGLAENTIVVFSADHGDMLGSHGFHAKQKPYDESIRVPLLVRWPKELKPRTLDTVFASEDFMPTLLALCHIDAPKTVEGRDLSKYIRDGGQPSENVAMISCVAPFGEWDRRRGGKEFRGIRTERYTYVRDLSGPWLLFDNAQDPLQLTNQVGNKSLQAKLDATLQAQLKKAHDEFLPAEAYIAKWGYHTNATGTVPYSD